MHRVLHAVCLYFLVFSPRERSASRQFLRRALGRSPTPADSYRQFFTFASTMLDRVYLLNGEYDRFEVCIHGEDLVRAISERGDGCLLLGAHLGSFEMLSYLGGEARGLPVSLVMYEHNARKMNAVLASIGPARPMPVIELGKPESMLKVEEALARGEFIGMLADRTIEGEGTRACPFLGSPARFPTGPFRLAAMLKRPVVLMFALYGGGKRYDVFFETLPVPHAMRRGERERLVDGTLRRYVERLEHYCRMAPYNWFNFYDYWK